MAYKHVFFATKLSIGGKISFPGKHDRRKERNSFSSVKAQIKVEIQRVKTVICASREHLINNVTKRTQNHDIYCIPQDEVTDQPL